LSDLGKITSGETNDQEDDTVRFDFDDAMELSLSGKLGNKGG
jgi:hypothetical protein